MSFQSPLLVENICDVRSLKQIMYFLLFDQREQNFEQTLMGAPFFRGAGSKTVQATLPPSLSLTITVFSSRFSPSLDI